MEWVWLVLHWAHGQDVRWHLSCDRADTHPVRRRYRFRMWTEQHYGDLKGRGFDLEATHLRDAARLERLVSALCMTYVWFITLGAWLVRRGLRHLIARTDRLDKSYFRLGWDGLRRAKRLNLPFRLQIHPPPRK